MRQVTKGYTTLWTIYQRPNGHYGCVPTYAPNASRRRGEKKESLYGTEAEAVARCYELEGREHEEISNN